MEVLNGVYNQFQLADIIDRKQLIENALKLLELTYVHSARELPKIVPEKLIQLPGGTDWKAGR